MAELRLLSANGKIKFFTDAQGRERILELTPDKLMAMLKMAQQGVVVSIPDDALAVFLASVGEDEVGHT